MDKKLKIIMGVSIGLSILTLSLGLGLGLGLSKSPSQQVYDIVNDGDVESDASEYYAIQRENKIVCVTVMNEEQLKIKNVFYKYYTSIYGFDSDDKGDKISNSDYYNKYRGVEIFRKRFTNEKVTSTLGNSALIACYNKVNNG